MNNSNKITLYDLIHVQRNKLAGICLLLLLAFSTPILSNDNKVHVEVFASSNKGALNFGGLGWKDDLLYVCSYNRNVKTMNPNSGIFQDDAFVLPPSFSFPNDITVVPALNGFPAFFAVTSFLTGEIWVVFDDGSVNQANRGNFVVATETGPVNAFKYNPVLSNDNPPIPGLQGCQPIAFRPSKGLLYTQSGFDGTKILSIDPYHGSVPLAINLSELVSCGGFEFGADDLLYAPDVFNNRIVTINPDTGLVTPLFPDTVLAPVSLKIDKNGLIYFISRSTGQLSTYNTTTKQITLLATLPQALTSLVLNSDGTKAYVSNDQGQIFVVDTKTKAENILFQSQIVNPWDIAFVADSDNGSLYVADNGSLKQFDAKKGTLINNFKMDTTTSGLYGFGIVSGLQAVNTTNATAVKFVITDISVGSVAGLTADFSVHDYFNVNDITDPIGGYLFGKQPFSAVHVADPAGEYYLVVDPVDQKIIKIFPISTGKLPVDFVTGLNAPVKLKVPNDGFVYIVEAGQIMLNQPNTGRISRVALNNPANQEILLDKLNKPEGFDIFTDNKNNNQMLILEAGNNRIIQAPVVAASTATVVIDNLPLTNGELIYQYAPYDIHPFVGLACNTNGTQIWVHRTGAGTKYNDIIKISRSSTKA